MEVNKIKIEVEVLGQLTLYDKKSYLIRVYSSISGDSKDLYISEKEYNKLINL